MKKGILLIAPLPAAIAEMGHTDRLPHEQFKRETCSARAIAPTGEFSP